MMSFDYAKSLSRMEEIRQALDDPTTDLNNSLKLYEEGIALYRQMKTYLDEMEQKFEAIRAEADGDA
ncbi:MAG TPA: exodeoxyribonuclease VII small subunit [Tissierellia bacterium]|nr:exodeoxyribonuclease VII small subunit [Tissierellia bacterium]